MEAGRSSSLKGRSAPTPIPIQTIPKALPFPDGEDRYVHPRVTIKSIKDCLSTPTWRHLKVGLEQGKIRSEDLLTSKLQALGEWFIIPTGDEDALCHRERLDIHSLGLVPDHEWKDIPAVERLRERFDEREDRKRKRREDVEAEAEAEDVPLGEEGTRLRGRGRGSGRDHPRVKEIGVSNKTKVTSERTKASSDQFDGESRRCDAVCANALVIGADKDRGFAFSQLQSIPSVSPTISPFHLTSTRLESRLLQPLPRAELKWKRKRRSRFRAQGHPTRPLGDHKSLDLVNRMVRW